MRSLLLVALLLAAASLAALALLGTGGKGERRGFAVVEAVTDQVRVDPPPVAPTSERPSVRAEGAPREVAGPVGDPVVPAEALTSVEVRLRTVERVPPRSSKPAPGVDVELRVSRADGSTAPVRVTSDSSGEGTVSLEFPMAWWTEYEEALATGDSADDWQTQLTLRGRPLGLGILEKETTARIKEDLSAGIDLGVWRRPGTTLHGVVRHDGEPIQAGVALLEQREGRWRSAERAVYPEEGRFVFHVDGEGTYAVQARLSKVGSAWLPEVIVLHDRPPELLELDLAGEGTIEGRLVDPAGRGLRRHSMRVVPTHLVDSKGLNQTKRFELVRGDGLVDQDLWTDDEGVFRFSGLEMGDYRVLARGEDMRTYDVLAERISTGTVGLEFERLRHALVVRAVSEAGVPQPVEVLNPGDSRGLKAKVTVYCKEEKRGPDLSPRTPPWIGGTEYAAIALLEPGRGYVLAVFSRGHPVQVHRVRLAPSEYERVFEIEVPESLEPGVLEVVARVPGGAPFDKAGRIRIEEYEGGVTLVDLDERYSAGERRLELPPGKYRVTLSHTVREHSPRYVPVTEILEVRSGEVQRLEMELGAAGFLSLLATLEKPVEPGETGRSNLISVELVSVATGEVLEPLFPYRGIRPITHMGPVPRVPSGERLRAQYPFAVGEYTLRVRGTGHVTQTRRIRIEAGKTLRFEATLPVSE